MFRFVEVVGASDGSYDCVVLWFILVVGYGYAILVVGLWWWFLLVVVVYCIEYIKCF